MSPEQRIEELEDCITANDKELQEIYAENVRLKEVNAELLGALLRLYEHGAWDAAKAVIAKHTKHEDQTRS